MQVTKRFAIHGKIQLHTALNARPHAACTFAHSVDTAQTERPPPPFIYGR